jgi:hypothetical protein
MTLATGLLIGGVVLTLVGLAGVIACILKAKALKGEADHAKVRAAMHGLVALNMGSVGAAFLGLGLVVVGLIL